MRIVFSMYPGLTNTAGPEQQALSWDALVTRFGTHLELDQKDQAPLFGPYSLNQSLDVRCLSHIGGPRVGPHRCDQSVTYITAAVFDVDHGDSSAVEECNKRLDVAHIWYSTHSYDPNAALVTLRLLLPLEVGAAPGRWPSLRSTLINHYAIPCDPKTSKAASHSYYMPSCRPGAERIFEAVPGKYLNHTDFDTWENPSHSATTSLVWEPNFEVDEYDLEQLRETFHKKASGLARSKSDRSREKAALIYRMLAGDPLAEHSRRNIETSRLAAIISWSSPDTPVPVLCHLLRPSVDAMIAAGSKLTHYTVETMVVSSLRKKAEQDAKDKALLQYFEEMRAKALASAEVVS